MKNSDDKVKRYLAYCRTKPVTIWTWIKYEIPCKEPRYCRKLKHAMENALHVMVQQDTAVRVKSIRGKSAFRSRSDYPADVPF